VRIPVIAYIHLLIVYARGSSTRTVRALSEVEAFALRAEDPKFVATSSGVCTANRFNIHFVITFNIGNHGLLVSFK